MRQVITYLLIIIIAVFLAFGGSLPQTKARQDGSTTTTHAYGQPFKFHTSIIHVTAAGKTSLAASGKYKTGEVIALLADVIIWGTLLWIVVRMAELKSILFWRDAPHDTKNSKLKEPHAAR